MTPFRRTAALLALPLLLAACGSTQPGPDPGPGRIIFTRIGNGLADICAMDLNGKNFERLSTSYALEDWGAWSPDTLKIAYQSVQRADTTVAVHFHLYVMNSDGSNVTQLTFEDSATATTPPGPPTARRSHLAPRGTAIPRSTSWIPPDRTSSV